MALRRPQVFLVALQTLAANLDCAQDPSVHAYCLGVLFNTAPHAHALHAVCCQRLLALIGSLRRRYAQHTRHAAEAAAATAEWVRPRVAGWSLRLGVAATRTHLARSNADRHCNGGRKIVLNG